MPGWFRSEIDGHERRRIYMLSAGLKLDRDTAIDDLRVWQDRVMKPGSRDEFPSSAEFAERWGWSKTTAYRLMTNIDAWSDPSRLEEWRVIWNDRGTEVERERNDRETKRNGQKPVVDETRNDSGTTVEREWNESGHTRVVVTPPSPSPSTLVEQTHVGLFAPAKAVAKGEPTSPAAAVDPAASKEPTAKRSADFAEALRVWNTEVVPEVRKRGGTVSSHDRLKPSEGLGKKLRQRLDAKGLETVLLVVRWYATSNDSRADFLRTGGHELSTLLGAEKFDDYAARAASTAVGPKTGKHAHDAPAKPPAAPALVVDDAVYLAALAEAEAAARKGEEDEAKAIALRQEQRRNPLARMVSR